MNKILIAVWLRNTSQSTYLFRIHWMPTTFKPDSFCRTSVTNVVIRNTFSFLVSYNLNGNLWQCYKLIFFKNKIFDIYWFYEHKLVLFYSVQNKCANTHAVLFISFMENKNDSKPKIYTIINNYAQLIFYKFEIFLHIEFRLVLYKK